MINGENQWMGHHNRRAYRCSKSSGEKVTSQATILNSLVPEVKSRACKVRHYHKQDDKACGNLAPPLCKMADKISGIFVPAVIGIAVLAMITWLICGASFQFALSIAISVLIISCPCAQNCDSRCNNGRHRQGAKTEYSFRSGEALSNGT